MKFLKFPTIFTGMGHEHFWTSGTDQAEEGKWVFFHSVCSLYSYFWSYFIIWSWIHICHCDKMFLHPCLCQWVSVLSFSSFIIFIFLIVIKCFGTHAIVSFFPAEQTWYLSKILHCPIFRRNFFHCKFPWISTQTSHCFWRNLHRWQKFCNLAGSDGRDKSHLWYRSMSASKLI